MNQNPSQQSEQNKKNLDKCNENDCKKEHCDISCSNQHQPHHFRSDAIIGNEGDNTNTWTVTQETKNIEICKDKNCSKEHCQTNCDKTHTSHHQRQEKETNPNCADKTTTVREYCETNCTKTHDYPHNYRQGGIEEQDQYAKQQQDQFGKTGELSNQQGQFDQNKGSQTSKMPTGQDYLRVDKEELRQDYGQEMPRDRMPGTGEQATQGTGTFRDEQFHQNQFKEGNIGLNGYPEQSEKIREQEIKEDKIPHGPQLHKPQGDIGSVPKDTKVLHDQGLIDKKGQYIHDQNNQNSNLIGDRH